MSRRIIWSRNATAHVREIVDYIVNDNPKAALAVQGKIDTLVGRLATMPHIGRPGRVEGTRELVIPAYASYLVVYEILESEIHVLAVRHSARRWPQQFDI